MISELRHKYQISKLIKLAELPRSTYYYISSHKKIEKYADIKNQMSKIFKENNQRLGYRRMTLASDKQGVHINHKTVQRLMKQAGLICLVRIKKYRSYKGEAGKIAPNLLNREFHADKPNEKWVTDVTEFSLFGKKLYLSTILDLYNGEIISYSFAHHPNFSLIADMLKNTFEQIADNTNLILHSDQGWQYQMKPYQRMLSEKGIRQSMSRKGNCLDNAVMENFFGHLKSELLYLQTFRSMEHFIDEMIEYIEYYNHRRIKVKLKGLSPVNYRIQSSLVA